MLSKVLASKLKPILPSIIMCDQTAYVAGRFIGESARLISDILEITKKLDIEGYILTIDIEKAFDSVENHFLIAVMENYGFSQNYIDWIKVIPNKQEGCVMNNGHSTGYFRLERGTRQGDPISAYLFIMIIAGFFTMIQENQNIRGINIF